MRTIHRVATAVAVVAVAVGAALAVNGAASAKTQVAAVDHAGYSLSAPVLHDGVSASALAWSNAVQRADLNAIRILYGPDTTAYGPSGAMQLKGVQANVDNYAYLFANYTAVVKLSDAHYFSAGETLDSFGLFTLTLTPKAGGAKVVINGRFSDVAVWVSTPVGSGWRYIVDHSSVPAA